MSMVKNNGVTIKLPQPRRRALLVIIGILISLRIFSVFRGLSPLSDAFYQQEALMIPSPSVSSRSSPCPNLKVSQDGEWSLSTKDGSKIWIWKEPSGKTYQTRTDYSPPNTDGSDSDTDTTPTKTSLSNLLKRHNSSLVFYGSSHIRELYASLIRLEQGLPYHKELPEEVTYLPSGSRYQSKECDPTRRGWITGLLGVDLEKCGLPGRRMVPELGDRVAIGFKTFLHTPEADSQFLDFLSQHGLREPDVVVVDVGIWGPRGTKIGGTVDYELTPDQELSYYMKWIRTSFPQSKIVFVFEHLKLFPALQTSILKNILDISTGAGKYPVSAYVLRKDYLLKSKPRRMPCGHGCAGPVMNTAALVFLEWLEKSVSDAAGCIR